jgi:16S rRNA processing protein RimM
VELGELPVAEEGEYYWVDLIGAEVVDAAGGPLGTVRALLETGANDVLVVAGEQERLIPFALGSVVLEVDVPGRRVRVDWEDP